MTPCIENCMWIPFCSLSYPSPKAQCFEYSREYSANVNCKVSKDPEDRQLPGSCYLWGTWKISLAHSSRGSPKHRKAESCSKGHGAKPLQSLLSAFMSSFFPGSCLTMPNSTFTLPIKVTRNRKVTIYPQQITCCHFKEKKKYIVSFSSVIGS